MTTKARLILLIVFAALLAVLMAKGGQIPFGMNDGPWID